MPFVLFANGAIINQSMLVSTGNIGTEKCPDVFLLKETLDIAVDGDFADV
jgi:hypothetical protein